MARGLDIVDKMSRKFAVLEVCAGAVMDVAGEEKGQQRLGDIALTLSETYEELKDLLDKLTKAVQGSL